MGEESQRFEAVALPHLGAAYNLARWLTRNDQDAEDVVQDACERALKHHDGFRGQNARAWLLAIVRNCAYTRLGKVGRPGRRDAPFVEEEHVVTDPAPGALNENPEAALIRKASGQRIQAAIDALPVEYREVFVLRELEGLSYKEIADVADVPLGTVMSRLSRARTMLQKRLAAQREEGRS